MENIEQLLTENYAAEDAAAALEILKYGPLRRGASALIAQQQAEFNAYAGESDITSFIADRYHAAYQDGWQYLYHSPTGMNGCESGKWWEGLNAAILTAALQQNEATKGLVVGSKASDTEDHDNYIGYDADNIIISQECKLQSDKTSLKKALDSSIQNKAYVSHCTIAFATNNCFTSRNGSTAISVLEAKGISTEDATRVVGEIIAQRHGAFRVNADLSILILGINEVEYIAWDNKPMANHGGSKGWTLAPESIQTIVDYLAAMLYNAVTDGE